MKLFLPFVWIPTVLLNLAPNSTEAQVFEEFASNYQGNGNHTIFGTRSLVFFFFSKFYGTYKPTNE